MEFKDKLGIKINELAIIVSEGNPTWSLTKIVNFICIYNQDLDGFLKSNVRKNITDENRILLDVKVTKPKRVKALPSELLEEFRQQKGTIVQNNVAEEKTEEKNFYENSIVPEQSSSTELDDNDSTAAMPQEVGEAVDQVYDLEDDNDDQQDQEDDQQEVKYDNPQKIIKQYEDTLIKLNKQYEELEQKYEELISNYTVEDTIAGKDQDIAVLIHVDPYKKTAWVGLDKKIMKQK
jgi:hypothetical protein